MRNNLYVILLVALAAYGVSAMIAAGAHADSTTICTKTESGVICTTTTTSKFPAPDEGR